MSPLFDRHYTGQFDLSCAWLVSCLFFAAELKCVPHIRNTALTLSWMFSREIECSAGCAQYLLIIHRSHVSTGLSYSNVDVTVPLQLLFTIERHVFVSLVNFIVQINQHKGVSHFIICPFRFTDKSISGEHKLCGCDTAAFRLLAVLIYDAARSCSLIISQCRINVTLQSYFTFQKIEDRSIYKKV